jgi:prephenate dehydrogenase
MKRLGILGAGSFGQFMVSHLAPHFAVELWDPADRRTACEALGASWTSFESCVSCDVVVPAVPVQLLEETLLRAAPRLRSGALWVDVASVKVIPVKLMQTLLPAGVLWAATHPMFGPQSGRGGIAGLKLVLCPLQEPPSLRPFLEQELGLQVFTMTPEEHDREIAYIQGLTHWMARALREIQMPNFELATPAYRHLLAIEEILRQDSDALFLTIQRENPFAHEARAQLRARLDELERWIESDASAKTSPCPDPTGHN